jgi:hypothetical protein
MKRRIEPEPSLGGKFSGHPDVRDQELILEDFAGEFRTDKAAQRRARAVAGDPEIGFQMIAPVRRLDGETDMVVALFQSDHLVAPAQIDLRQVPYAIDQKRLGVILLQIDKGRHLVAVVRQQIELIQQIVFEKDLADLPDDSLLDHALANAETIPQLQRPFREANRARAVADPVGVIQHDDRMAALRQIDRQRQPDRPCPDDHDRMARGIRGRPVLVGMAAIAELGDRRLRHVSNPVLTGFLQRSSDVAARKSASFLRHVLLRTCEPKPHQNRNFQCPLESEVCYGVRCRIKRTSDSGHWPTG